MMDGGARASAGVSVAVLLGGYMSDQVFSATTATRKVGFLTEREISVVWRMRAVIEFGCGWMSALCSFVEI